MLTFVVRCLLQWIIFYRLFIRLSSGVPNLFLTMYPFSISTDEHVPLKFFMAKRLSEIKSTEFLIKLIEFWNYQGRLFLCLKVRKSINALIEVIHEIESIELWNKFSRPWQSIEFGQNVYKVLEKYGNSKFCYLLIQIFFFIYCWWQFCRCSLRCVTWIKFSKNEDKWWY